MHFSFRQKQRVLNDHLFGRRFPLHLLFYTYWTIFVQNIRINVISKSIQRSRMIELIFVLIMGRLIVHVNEGIMLYYSGSYRQHLENAKSNAKKKAREWRQAKRHVRVGLEKDLLASQIGQAGCNVVTSLLSAWRCFQAVHSIANPAESLREESITVASQKGSSFLSVFLWWRKPNLITGLHEWWGPCPTNRVKKKCAYNKFIYGTKYAAGQIIWLNVNKYSVSRRWQDRFFTMEIWAQICKLDSADSYPANFVGCRRVIQ